MNWLMYVGGGWIFTWTFVILSTKSFTGALDNDMVKFIAGTGIASLMVWIWICWRFIA